VEPGKQSGLPAVTNMMNSVCYDPAANTGSSAIRHQHVRMLLLLAAVFVTACSGATRPAAGSGMKSSSQGDLQVETDGHWLSFRGHTVLLIGDSVTQGWMELGSNFNQTAYVDALAERAINILMIWSYIGIVDQIGDARIGYDAPEIWPWVQTAGIFDLNQLNDAYFDRLRALVQYADSKDIAVLITIHDGWTKTRFAGHPFNQAKGGPLTDRSQYVELADYANEMTGPFNAAWSRQQKNQYWLERYCDRLIQATADQPNVIYEMFNEGEWYNQTNLRNFETHFLDFFKARTSRVTMVEQDAISGTSFRGVANCNMISYHHPNWSSATSATDSFNVFAPEFAGTPAKPFYFSEPVPEYQGDASLHDALMRLMWGTVLGGAGFVVQNDASFGFDPNAAIAAQSANRDIVLNREGHCARFFNSSIVNLAAMSPHGPLASSGVCLANPGTEYAVYTQNGSSVTVDLSAVNGDLAARFYDPRTGDFQQEFTVQGGGPRSVTKPGSNDWVLHLLVRPRVIGDLDGDGDVDQYDFGLLQRCYSGIGERYDSGCEYGDLDFDEDVDVNDFSVFFGCMQGPGVPVDANCQT
jgi:hypothetical protein